MKPKEIKIIAARELEFTKDEWDIMKGVLVDDLKESFGLTLIRNTHFNFSNWNFFSISYSYDPPLEIPFVKLRYAPNKKRIENTIVSTMSNMGWDIKYSSLFNRTAFKNGLYKVEINFQYTERKKLYSKIFNWFKSLKELWMILWA